LVALGAPWQEQWVIQHQALLKQQHVSIVMVVGGAIDMILGRLFVLQNLFKILV
jgi:UDP-N-acetyl-D-mannosaminuronic acid transferase (WecB/TagA/CpsF family)